jgi:hypothetical protein
VEGRTIFCLSHLYTFEMCSLLAMTWVSTQTGTAHHTLGIGFWCTSGCMEDHILLQSVGFHTQSLGAEW